jgi:hypothetical protein
MAWRIKAAVRAPRKLSMGCGSELARAAAGGGR